MSGFHSPFTTSAWAPSDLTQLSTTSYNGKVDGYWAIYWHKY